MRIHLDRAAFDLPLVGYAFVGSMDNHDPCEEVFDFKAGHMMLMAIGQWDKDKSFPFAH